MESWIDFGRGPLFRFTYALLIFGLLRAVGLTVWGLVESYRRSADRVLPWREVRRQTVLWLFPVDRLLKKRPFYSILSLLFHVGLISVPLLLGAHVLLWRRWVGVSWPAMPQILANWLTLLTIVTGAALFFARLFDSRTRTLSRAQDYVWPLLLITPFITGYCCATVSLTSVTYTRLMLIHVYSADLIFALLPFTKLVHCVLMPFSHTVGAVSWKFPAGAGERVLESAGYQSPVWRLHARLEKVGASKGARL